MYKKIYVMCSFDDISEVRYDMPREAEGRT